MKILVTGGAGFIGAHVAAALRNNGHEVVVASRANGVDFNQLQTADYWLAHLRGVNAVVNCVGIIVETPTQSFSILHHRAPVALFYACLKAKVNRVIQVSALGADEHASTPFLTSKRSADEALRRLPLDWFVIRPSLVVGAGGRSAALFQRLATLPIMPLIGGGRQRIQPVHIDDVVAAVCQCLHAVPAQRTIDVVGPQVMTVRSRLQTLRNASSMRRAWTLSIPYSLAVAIGHVAKRLVPLFHPDNLRMLQAGNTADVQPFAEFIGRMPRELS